MKVAILYHDNCYDGAAAAAAAMMWCRENDHTAEVVPQRYNNAPPSVGQFDRVLVVDFSYPREVMEKLAAEAKEIVVYDHHKTAQEALVGLPYVVFDMNRSGAGITYDELFPGDRRPWWVSYAEDRDLWKFVLPNSKEINSFFQTLRPVPETFLDLGNDAHSKDLAIQLGTGAQMFIDCYVREMNDNLKRRCQVEEYPDIPVLNVPYKETSSVVGEAAHYALFAIGWHQSGNGKYLYSLRSASWGSNFDVSEFAKRFGGGGHRNAAGFNADKQLW